MNSQDALKWNQMILAAIDGTISREDFECLDNAIRTSPEVANHYVLFMLLYTGLRQPGQVSTFFTEAGAKSDSGLDMELWNEMADFEKTAETVEVVLPTRVEPAFAVDIEPVRVEHKVSRLAVITSILSIAALVLIGIFVYMNPRTTQPVGVLTKTVNAKWLNKTGTFETGQDLQKGLLYLEQGLAQICFESGAKVILEGPAQVELLGVNSMNVLAGKIVATVRRDAVGFVVDTPQGKILDLGTEFGIQVNQNGQSQVHVFQGEVVLYPKGNKDHFNLLQGFAKAMDQAGGVTDIPLRAAVFVRQDEMDVKLLAQSGDSYSRWKSWVFDIHRDPSLVAHYIDVKDDTQSGLLLNSASGANGSAGQFGGQGRAAPQWVEGRWPGKSAIRFQRGKNQSILIPANPALAINGPIAISSWVYYPDEKNRGGHLISCRRGFHVYYQFAIFDDHYFYNDQRNRFEFLRLNEEGDKGLYSKEFIQQAGVWYHFAMTYDGQNVSFYVNGQLFETRLYHVAAQSNVVEAELILGAMKARTADRFTLPEGDFDGVVDELMIFKRNLTAGEIKEIYEIGTPASR
jgi:hypothetical protein